MEYASRQVDSVSSQGYPANDAGSLTDLISRLSGKEPEGYVNIGQLITRLGQENRNTLLLVPALLAFSPATIVFGVATICGLTIFVIAMQLLAGRETIWLPRFMAQFRLRNSLVDRATKWLERPARWIDTHTKPRMTAFVSGRLADFPIVIAACLGVSLPFLEFVPLSATLGGFAITLMILGNVLRDGLLTLVGILAAGLIGTAIAKVAVNSVLTAASLLPLQLI